jgi:hypothetical protein
MARQSLLRFLNPWKHRREERERRVAALRQRDGDACRRCRRPMRFDLPFGHDLGARIEPVAGGAAADKAAIGDLCLTHGRCNVSGQDHTGEVIERLRPRPEADLFAKARENRAA